MLCHNHERSRISYGFDMRFSEYGHEPLHRINAVNRSLNYGLSPTLRSVNYLRLQSQTAIGPKGYDARSGAISTGLQWSMGRSTAMTARTGYKISLSDSAANDYREPTIDLQVRWANVIGKTDFNLSLRKNWTDYVHANGEKRSDQETTLGGYMKLDDFAVLDSPQNATGLFKKTPQFCGYISQMIKACL